MYLALQKCFPFSFQYGCTRTAYTTSHVPDYTQNTTYSCHTTPHTQCTTYPQTLPERHLHWDKPTAYKSAGFTVYNKRKYTKVDCQRFFGIKGFNTYINSKKWLPCAVCVFVYILKPGSCFLALQFEELRCSSNQIPCACLESVQSSVFDSFKFSKTSPSYCIKCRELCHMIHLIVNNM